MLHTVGDLLSIDGVLESVIGGRGVATKLAHDRIPFDANPLGPDNRLSVTTRGVADALDEYYRTHGWHADGTVPDDPLVAGE